ncbi:circadian clock KaiB family protein [Burkholderia sp. 22PA0106]|uniref:circadian clock KaiB family protein n=1 Tax=Burkholderia sp. 22PA0106 TaxID=3237371 RepID=UPI0039C21348
MKLYVTGSTPRSARAIENAGRLCATVLAGRVDLQIIDLYLDPEAGMEDQIIAVPTLVKVFPLPVRRIIGDLSDRDKLLSALSLPLSGVDKHA